MSRARISASVEFDDARYFAFARSSGLPIGYFGRRRDWRVLALRVATVIVAIAAVAVLAI